MTDAITRNTAYAFNPTVSTGSTDSTTASKPTLSTVTAAPGQTQTPSDTVGQFQHPGGKFAITQERNLGNVQGQQHKATAKETAAASTNWGDTAPGSTPLLHTIASHLNARAPNYGKARDSSDDDAVTSNYGDGYGDQTGKTILVGAGGIPVAQSQGYGQGGYGEGNGNGNGDGYSVDGPQSYGDGQDYEGDDSYGDGYGETEDYGDGDVNGDGYQVDGEGYGDGEEVDEGYGDGEGVGQGDGESYSDGYDDGMTWTGGVNPNQGQGQGQNYNGQGQGYGNGNGEGYGQGQGYGYDQSQGYGQDQSYGQGQGPGGVPNYEIDGYSHEASAYNNGAADEPDVTSDAVGLQGESYLQVNPNAEELYGASGPSATDVTQGDAGDCYFLSNLAGVAAQNPDLIKNNIQPAGQDPNTGANLYNVTLYYQGKPETVQVDDKFLANEQMGSTAYAQLGTDSTNGNAEIWPALYEKAFAQLCTTHPDILAGDGDTGEGYNLIGGGGTSAQALSAITGQSATTYFTPTSGTGAWEAADDQGNATGQTMDINQILESANAGDVVTSGSLSQDVFSTMSGYNQQTGAVTFSDGSSLSEDSNEFLQYKDPTGSLTTLAAGHEYTVLGMDPENGSVILRNPWGNNPDPSKVYNPNDPMAGNASSTGTFELPVAVYQKMFGNVTESPSGADGSTSAPSTSGGGL